MWQEHFGWLSQNLPVGTGGVPGIWEKAIWGKNCWSCLAFPPFWLKRLWRSPASAEQEKLKAQAQTPRHGQGVFHSQAKGRNWSASAYLEVGTMAGNPTCPSPPAGWLWLRRWASWGETMKCASACMWKGFCKLRRARLAGLLFLCH